MDDIRISILMMDWKDKVPQDSVLVLQERLRSISDEKILVLSQIPLKNPMLGLILGPSFGIFGIDRFYKGDIGLGIAKLMMGILYVVSLIYEEEISQSNVWFLGLLPAFMMMFWIILDCFLVWRRIKKDNLQHIQNVLYML